MKTSDATNGEKDSRVNSETAEESKVPLSRKQKSIEDISVKNVYQNNPFDAGLFSAAPKMKVKNEFKKRIKPKQKSCRGNEEFIDFMEQNWGTFNDHINEMNEEQKEHIKKHFNGLFEG